MKKTEPQSRILIIHGPNMNLIGKKTINKGKKITLNKINNCLQKEAKNIEHQLKIIQTNDESVAVTALQRQRNKISGIIIFPGPWQKSAHVLKDTLEILQIPYTTISTGEEVDILTGMNNIKETDLLKGCIIAMTALKESI